MKFRPLHDRVVVRRIDAEEKTAGGIIIPDTAKEKPQQGEVLAVGPGKRDEAGKLIPPDVKAGDQILFGKWSGTEVKVDGEDLLIMKEDDIMGVVEGAAKSKTASSGTRMPVTSFPSASTRGTRKGSAEKWPAAVWPGPSIVRGSLMPGIAGKPTALSGTSV